MTRVIDVALWGGVAVCSVGIGVGLGAVAWSAHRLARLMLR